MWPWGKKGRVEEGKALREEDCCGWEWETAGKGKQEASVCREVRREGEEGRHRQTGQETYWKIQPVWYGN